MQSPSIEGMTHALSLHDLTVALIKHFDLHEGLYDLSFEMQMGGGSMASELGQNLPGAFFMIRQAGLLKVAVPRPNTVDAAQVNPAKKPSRARKPKSG